MHFLPSSTRSSLNGYTIDLPGFAQDFYTVYKCCGSYFVSWREEAVVPPQHRSSFENGNSLAYIHSEAALLQLFGSCLHPACSPSITYLAWLAPEGT